MSDLVLNIIQVGLPPIVDIPVGLSGLNTLPLLLIVGLRSEAPDCHLVDAEGGGDGGDRERMEVVDVIAGCSLSQVLVELQTEIPYKCQKYQEKDQDQENKRRN